MPTKSPSCKDPIIVIHGDMIEAEGMIELEVKMGITPKILIMTLNFLVVKLDCVHNVSSSGSQR